VWGGGRRGDSRAATARLGGGRNVPDVLLDRISIATRHRGGGGGVGVDVGVVVLGLNRILRALQLVYTWTRLAIRLVIKVLVKPSDR
jgi:uncharacterized protein with ACT and thioredoxin-like domain